MKFFFDTSVLVAAVSVQHVHHAPSLAVYLAGNRNQACCAAHSLAELYAALTRLPGKQSMSCEQALLFLDEINDRLRTVVLDSEEYCSAIADAAAEGLVRGYNLRRPHRTLCHQSKSRDYLYVEHRSLSSPGAGSREKAAHTIESS